MVSSGEPNGDGQDCMAITYDGGAQGDQQWTSENCSAKLGVVCKIGNVAYVKAITIE